MGIRPYGAQGGNGKVQVTKINYSEIGSYSRLPKEEVKMCVERMIKHLADEVRSVIPRLTKKSSLEIDIPGLGFFVVKNGIAAVSFNESISQDVKLIVKRPLTEKRQKGEVILTQETMKQFDLIQTLHGNANERDSEFLSISDGARNYLSNSLNINVGEFTNLSRISLI